MIGHHEVLRRVRRAGLERLAWVHRHFGESPYANLPLLRLRFERRIWSFQQLGDISFGSDWGSIANDLTQLDAPVIRQTPLAQMWGRDLQLLALRSTSVANRHASDTATHGWRTRAPLEG